MLIPFIAANVILWVGLGATAFLASFSQQVALDSTILHWLLVTGIGAAAGVVIGHLYDGLIPAVSSMLPSPITPRIFGTASLTVVALAILAATNVRVTIFDNPASNPLVLVGVAAVFYAGYEIWPFLSGEIPGFPRAVLAVVAGMFVFALALMLPVWVFGSFVDYYNAGFASYMAGWVAALASRQLKRLLGSASIEAAAGEDVVKALVQRDLPVLVSVVLVYLVAKAMGGSLIVFSIAVGVVAPLLLAALAQLLPD